MKKFFKSINSFCRKVARLFGICCYILVACCVTVLTSCQHATPTKVPPGAEALGFKVPNWKGWTTVGINEFTYSQWCVRLEAYRQMADLVNEPALEAREMVINWGNMAMSAGLFGGIPLALRRIPKNAVSKEERDRDVMKAGLQDPNEFRDNLFT